MSSADSMAQAANSSSIAGSSTRRGRAPSAGSRSTLRCVGGDQLHQQASVDPGRVEVGHGVDVALLPVADEVGVERHGPGHAALEEGEAQLGEAPGHAAQEQRLGQGVLALGQVADVVVHVVGGRHPAAPPDRARVEGDRHPQLAAAGPHRVVVVGAVEAVGVEPAGPGRRRRRARPRPCAARSRRGGPTGSPGPPRRGRWPRPPPRACASGWRRRAPGGRRRARTAPGSSG